MTDSDQLMSHFDLAIGRDSTPRAFCRGDIPRSAICDELSCVDDSIIIQEDNDHRQKLSLWRTLVQLRNEMCKSIQCNHEIGIVDF